MKTIGPKMLRMEEGSLQMLMNASMMESGLKETSW